MPRKPKRERVIELGVCAGCELALGECVTRAVVTWNDQPPLHLCGPCAALFLTKTDEHEMAWTRFLSDRLEA